MNLIGTQNNNSNLMIFKIFIFYIRASKHIFSDITATVDNDEEEDS